MTTEIFGGYDGDWFTAIAQTIDKDGPGEPAFQYFADSQELSEWVLALLDKLPTPAVIGIDTETGGFDPHTCPLLFVQLYVEGEPPVIIDVRRIGYESVRNLLWPILTDPAWLKVGHNLNFDYQFISAHLGITMRRMYDTMLAEQVLTAGLALDYNLSATVARYTGVVLDKSVRSAFTVMDNEADATEEQLHYMADDVRYLITVMDEQYRQLKRKDLLPTARLEFRTLPALAEASLRGVHIDRERWAAHIASLEKRRDEIGATLQETLQPYYEEYFQESVSCKLDAYDQDIAAYTEAKGQQEALARVAYDAVIAAGGTRGDARKAFNQYKKDNPLSVKRPQKVVSDIAPVNLGSHDQLQGALQKMGVELPLKDSGKMETGREFLVKVAGTYPVIADLLQYRAYDKLVNGYGPVIDKLDSQGRLHPDFNQLVATGRMSCRNPNVQQVPGNELGQEFRRCFVAQPGRRLISADYSQIELRLLLEFADQRDAIEAVNGGLDLHSQTASAMFGVPYDEVMKHKDGKHKHIRHVAKTINFGIAYGLTPQGLANQINRPVEECGRYISQYYAANPQIDTWITDMREQCFAQGYAVTGMGRKRFAEPIPIRREADPREYDRLRQRVQRQLVNHIIQGTSADITKSAVCGIRSSGIAESLDAHMVMFVHDELVIDCPEEVAEEVAYIVKVEMQRAAALVLKKVKPEVAYQINEYWSH